MDQYILTVIGRYAYKKLQEWRAAREAPQSPDDTAQGLRGDAVQGATAFRAPNAGPVALQGRDKDVIEARGLVKRFGSLTAVDDVSFDVAIGEIFGLLGPNGAGKTTTLEMLEGLRAPDAGDAVVLVASVARYPRVIKERIGVQLQATALPPKTKVAEAIDLFGAFYRQRRPTAELLAELDLEDKASTLTESLSGGQMQRLSIALALVNDPDLVFLDEPTTGLDPQARLNLWDIIERLRAGGKTVMLTTHYMEEAQRLCDRLAIINRGHIVALDTPEKLIATYAPGATIEFDTPLSHMASSYAIPGVDSVDATGERVSLHTAEPEMVLTQLFDPGAAWSELVTSMRDLRVRQGTLEDVFIALTGRTLRS